MRGKYLGLVLLMASLVLTGQVRTASAAVSDVPPDTPDQFLKRYGRFVFKHERKALEQIEKKLRDLGKKHASEEASAPLKAERDSLITTFWTIRDTDPATPENEFKNVIDQRIDDIASERFFATSRTPGLTFSANGGFYGDMATVYLLQGVPDGQSVLENQTTITDLMLWRYDDPETGDIRFLFLFYRPGGGGPFRLFPQDSYRMDPCGAISEILSPRSIMGASCDDPRVADAIQRLLMANASDDTPGRVFAIALTNFSPDPTVLQGQTLQPPVPAKVIAQQSKSHVVGQAPTPAGTAGVDYVYSSCEYCQSLIPAALELNTFTLTVARKDLDWLVEGDMLRTGMNAVVLFESTNHPGTRPISFERGITIKTPRENLEKPDPLVIPLLKLAEIAAIPAGSYRATVYLKNVFTKKYFAKSVRFTK